MRVISLTLLCLTLYLSNLSSQSLDTYSEATFDLISDEEIKARLTNISNDVVTPKFTPAVRSYINTYTVKKRDRTESMLGRRAIYYPLFEKLLAENGLPTDLKFLSVVESALDAKAVSRSGAVGLWQFMPQTGKEYGLKISRTIDERMDPQKATEAAIKYLGRLYKKYGNWELALAAYNGGPGRVNRAIKRGRSKNFWRIRRYLPRETRAYVPAYIAATYINHYYEQHHLKPVYPDTEFQITERVKVYDHISFAEISAITGTPDYLIEYLNPSYKRKYIPANQRGNNLVLPEGKMAIFKNNYRLPDQGDQQYTAGSRIYAPSVGSNAPANTTKLYYTVTARDNIQTIAQAFYCTENDIMKWNRLTSRNLRNGQNLTIYFNKSAIKPVELIRPIPLADAQLATNDINQPSIWKPIPLPANVETAIPSKSKSTKSRKSKARKKKKKDKRYIYHKIERGESLFTIAAQYPGITVHHLIELNQIESGEAIQPGNKIKIKKK